MSKELVGASVAPIVLSILRNSDSYGYEIVQKVKELTKNRITWKEASIYPVLKKLESKGMIKSYWKVIENERPRKYYTLLADGKEKLKQEVDEWQLINSLLGKLAT
ncbi:PadR family transcriptional regulator [Olivibacter sitiensis]|uniref:PadR family transcriptional regulator n=1 Tax=Olivibacter sitiensis TaxID=376470 RepID=UPI00055F0C51|nr:PadR family transcriptional regulator [Olivibacter sitiensis]